MWPAETSNGKGLLYLAVKEVTDVLCNLGIGTNTFFVFWFIFYIFSAIDGGKDSVSMSSLVGSERIDSPPTFVISGYVGCTDIRKVIVPGFKRENNSIWCIEGSHSDPQRFLLFFFWHH